MSHDLIFHGNLAQLDPDVHEIIERETTRQRETIILVASASDAPDSVMEAESSSFTNIIAEGYPREASRKQTQAQILDFEYELAHYRRNSDPRYYKGVEYANTIESLARRRAAELFAANGVKPSNLYVNVQAFGGGVANSCIYTALLQPGDTILGLKLSDGGHLSHGASANRTGAIYNSVTYAVDPEKDDLDFDAIEQLALQTKPKIIVAGFSAYPLIIDWQRFRAIADKVGAYLLADIAHIGGMVAAGVHPSPIGIADVVMATTHKSLCGPCGALIMTHRRDLGRKMDAAVFPGEQGSPHHNAIAAIAVAMKLANSDQFRTLQQRIVDNAARLAARLQSHGLHIPFGGSQNHMLLVDCKSIRVDGVPLTGDMAARILDLAGIVVNRNNIPGDRSQLNPFGIRIGTVWISQRGFGADEVDQLGDAIALLLKGITPFFYRGSGKEFRAKVDPAALARARAVVAKLTGAQSSVNSDQLSVSVRGSKAARFLDAALASNVLTLGDGEAQASHVFGHSVDAAGVLERQGDRYLLHFDSAETAGSVAQWLRDLSDAYVQFSDLHARLVGPIVATTVAAQAPAVINGDGVVASKPFFVGQENVAGESLPAFVWKAPAGTGLKTTGLHATHKALGAKMVDFGGYDMPVWYTGVSEEHEAVRSAAGLFDVSHMGAIDVAGAGSAEFLNTLTSNDVYALRVGQSHYTYLLDLNGRVIDDLLIYRLPDRYLLVVNASNFDEDWAWMNAVNNGEARISNEQPHIKIQQPVILRDLRDPESGADQRVDIALQGPTATKTLQAMADVANAKKIGALKWGRLTQCEVAGIDIILSRTGYTGERVGYEIFVHPDNLVALWNAILEAGAQFGVKPCGLAARDSTRTEAGLPLHGHELAGPLAINPLESGFGKYLKLHKPFFIGRTAFIKSFLNFKRILVRFQMNDKGVRRPEQGDPILDKRGKVVGTVTSCAINRAGYLMGLALVPLDMRKVGTTLQIYQTGGGKRAIRVPKKVKMGARLPLPNAATVVSRFPKK